MNTQTVTPQTAAKLAAAGFPQPHPAPGQWWGDNDGVVFVFGETYGKYTPVVHYVGDGRPWVDDYFDAADFTGLVFLTTVGDLLRTEALLGYGVSIQYDTTESGFSWICAPMEWSMPDMVSAYHETSAAEAAALAWLSIHEKK
jgi:hypothetical protein